MLSEAWRIAYAGWETVLLHDDWHGLAVEAAYILAASLCFAVRQASRRSGESGAGWLAAAALLALLGINALYRIDILITTLARAVARQQGWYGDRREGQYLLLVLLGGAALLTLGWLRARLKQVWSECLPAVAGLGTLLALAALRLISFHDTDALLNLRVAGIPAGRLIELAGLCLTVAGAMRRLHARSSGDRTDGNHPDHGHDTPFRRRL